MAQTKPRSAAGPVTGYLVLLATLAALAMVQHHSFDSPAGTREAFATLAANSAAALLLFVGLVRQDRLEPLFAFAAAAWFLLLPPLNFAYAGAWGQDVLVPLYSVIAWIGLGMRSPVGPALSGVAIAGGMSLSDWMLAPALPLLGRAWRLSRRAGAGLFLAAALGAAIRWLVIQPSHAVFGSGLADRAASVFAGHEGQGIEALADAFQVIWMPFLAQLPRADEDQRRSAVIGLVGMLGLMVLAPNWELGAFLTGFLVVLPLAARYFQDRLARLAGWELAAAAVVAFSFLLDPSRVESGHREFEPGRYLAAIAALFWIEWQVSTRRRAG